MLLQAGAAPWLKAIIMFFTANAVMPFASTAGVDKASTMIEARSDVERFEFGNCRLLTSPFRNEV